ncbi:MAG: tRNA (N6-isopentenyl adenosine(37)-C2)-methylthiotransferase MiaB [Oscillospiraceae bacterium]|nr:tRNA (N6-isopentenyl adenosine(37)-C2)-methylthiotransferase MiaB [Oscillospiraceae bacterium]
MAYQRVEIPRERVEQQEEIAARIAARFAAEGRTVTAMVDTYGCQQNESDSERLRGYLAEMGCTFTDDEFAADIIVINTCAVREHAEQRVLGNVGALNHTKKARPGQIICLCGCMVQQKHIAEKIRMSYPIVNLVFGPDEIWRFPELLEQILTGRKKRVFAVETQDGVVTEGVPRARAGGVKAWLSVMYGCNNFCSYCVVPYVRGRERSRRPEDVVAEACALVAAGYRDITLLGQNVNSYGRDLGGGTDFSDLLRMVNDIPGKFILRFMTSHPKDATEKLFSTMAECEKCAHHIHLPVQAGNDRVLREMNRGYTAAQYLDKVAAARRSMPDLVLTTDIIVGFPGETDAEFADTLALVEQVRYDSMFTFIYSPRVGTRAAAMPDPMTRAEKQRNFDRLLELSNRISGEKHAAYVGKTLEVLVDGENPGEACPHTSRTKSGRLVHLRGDAAPGAFVTAKITDSTTWALFGEVVN